MSPEGEASAETDGHQNRRAAVAKLQAFWLSREKIINDGGKIPLRDMHDQIGVQTAEAGEILKPSGSPIDLKK
ncbi:MAG: hypothetical protein Q9202_006759 [Teloschistes flavicans]